LDAQRFCLRLALATVLIVSVIVAVAVWLVPVEGAQAWAFERAPDDRFTPGANYDLFVGVRGEHVLNDDRPLRESEFLSPSWRPLPVCRAP
jgi:hypothetical protein